ncbi:MAG: hypothetical protein A2287_01070 [Candidatus Melainabacteria bacterium RIFOXYA12_FULL_32_12]|nr:MAG: hypothetical protein A2255_04280 [Candidatus Melainabacteria bacterium RIFOXYA2_FULL_32_9]OGI31076.1 MAG: hypothetical protein A2287_01070 [Candidatus Melainabacteria bacterium RIFOXYA12_FULL_32_12]
MAEREHLLIGKHEERAPWKISDVLFTYVFIFALSIFAVGILLITNIDTQTSLFPALLQVIISVATISVIYLIVTKKYNIHFFDAFGISIQKIPNALTTGIVVSIILILSTTIISYAFSEFAEVQKQNPYGNVPMEKLRIISIMAVFIAPIIEEIFFRGFMQPALVKVLGVFGGIFVTAMIFGFSHAQYLGYSTALVAVITIGLILGITRHQTGSVMPGIFAHLFNNLLAAISLLFVNAQ